MWVMSDRQNGQSALSLLVLEPIRARGGGGRWALKAAIFPPVLGPGEGAEGLPKERK